MDKEIAKGFEKILEQIYLKHANLDRKMDECIDRLQKMDKKDMTIIKGEVRRAAWIAQSGVNDIQYIRQNMLSKPELQAYGNLLKISGDIDPKKKG